MQTVVYVDVLLVVNFMVNYLLLFCCGLICGRQIKRPRLLFSALVGALFSLTIFLPRLGPFWMALIKLGAALLLTRLAFRWVGVWQLCKDTFVLFTVSFLLAGILLAVWIQFTPRGMLCYNGVVYFNISTLTLIGTTAAAYFIINLFTRIFHLQGREGEYSRVEVVIGGKSVFLTGMVDTGNRLREPFSGSPVAVCCAESLTSVLPLQIISLAYHPDLGEVGETASDFCLRMIPYSALGKDGALLALRPQAFYLVEGEARYRVEDVFLALSPRPVGDDQYNLLLSSEIIKLKIQ